ncbi:MAG TPA: hypothetical protein QF644_04155 [Candidatus Poseidoniaceae archaeon]|nr:hypothetical protein [Candidatus Poseidoniaceae archaeon]
MGEIDREAKAKLRSASEDLEELIKLFSEHLNESKEIFKTQIYDLRKNADLSLNTYSTDREQVIYNLTNIEKKLTKLSRQISKKKYDNKAASDQLIEIATTHGQVKKEYEEKRHELESSMNEWLKFTQTVSDIVTLIHTKSSEWEHNARELSIFYQDIADTSIPAEFQKTRNIILEYSISILLSAGKREQKDLMSFEEQLKYLMDNDSKNEEL